MEVNNISVVVWGQASLLAHLYLVLCTVGGREVVEWRLRAGRIRSISLCGFRLYPGLSELRFPQMGQVPPCPICLIRLSCY